MSLTTVDLVNDPADHLDVLASEAPCPAGQGSAATMATCISG
jgi:hypothetical protein